MRVLTFLICLTFPPFALGADVAKSWSKIALDYFDRPLSSTLWIMRDRGLVLVDVGGNYAAYSTRGYRLSPDERKNPLSTLDELGLAIDFQSCDEPNDRLMVGTVNRVTVRMKQEETTKFALELRGLVLMIEDMGFEKNSFGGSKSKSDQTFMLWSNPTSDANTQPTEFMEVQINEDPHQIVFTAYRNCP